MASPSKTCCPSGYTYIDNSGNYLDPLTLVSTPLVSYTGGSVTLTYNECVQRQNNTAIAFGSLIDPVDCPCCTSGSIWVLYGTTINNITGTCYNAAASVGLAGSPFFRPSLSGSIPCTTPPTICCPQGYTYVDGTNVPPGIGGYFINYAGVSQKAVTAIIGGPWNVCADTIALNAGTIFYSVQIPGTGVALPSQLPTAITVPCLVCSCEVASPFECGVIIPSESIVFNFDFNKKECTDCNPQVFTQPKGCISKFVANTLLDPTIYFTLKNKNFI